MGNLDFLYDKLLNLEHYLQSKFQDMVSHQPKVNVCLIYHFKELTLKIVATPGNKRRKTVTIFMHQFMTTIILEYFFLFIFQRNEKILSYSHSEMLVRIIKNIIKN